MAATVGWTGYGRGRGGRPPARFSTAVAGEAGIALARLARNQLTAQQQEALQRADTAANRRLQRLLGDEPVRRLSPAVAAIAFVSIVATATVGPAAHARAEVHLAAAMAVTAHRTRPARPFPHHHIAKPNGRSGRSPPPHLRHIQAFMAHAEALGAVGVSFWSWQGANDEAFAAIRDAPEFILPAGAAALAPGQLRCYQALLTNLGHPGRPARYCSTPPT